MFRVRCFSRHGQAEALAASGMTCASHVLLLQRRRLCRVQPQAEVWVFTVCVSTEQQVYRLPQSLMPYHHDSLRPG